MIGNVLQDDEFTDKKNCYLKSYSKGLVLLQTARGPENRFRKMYYPAKRLKKLADKVVAEEFISSKFFRKPVKSLGCRGEPTCWCYQLELLVSHNKPRKCWCERFGALF